MWNGCPAVRHPVSDHFSGTFQFLSTDYSCLVADGSLLTFVRAGCVICHILSMDASVSSASRHSMDVNCHISGHSTCSRCSPLFSKAVLPGSRYGPFAI